MCFEVLLVALVAQQGSVSLCFGNARVCCWSPDKKVLKYEMHMCAVYCLLCASDWLSQQVVGWWRTLLYVGWLSAVWHAVRWQHSWWAPGTL
jgi:hypothetical protein